MAALPVPLSPVLPQAYEYYSSLIKKLRGDSLRRATYWQVQGVTIATEVVQEQAEDLVACVQCRYLKGPFAVRAAACARRTGSDMLCPDAMMQSLCCAKSRRCQGCRVGVKRRGQL